MNIIVIILLWWCFCKSHTKTTSYFKYATLRRTLDMRSLKKALLSNSLIAIASLIYKNILPRKSYFYQAFVGPHPLLCEAVGVQMSNLFLSLWSVQHECDLILCAAVKHALFGVELMFICTEIASVGSHDIFKSRLIPYVMPFRNLLSYRLKSLKWVLHLGVSFSNN